MTHGYTIPVPANRPRKSEFKSWLIVIALGAIILVGAWLRSLPRAHGSHATRSGAGLANEFLARKERWSAKTGVDDDAAKIDVAHPKTTTVADLIALERPPDLPDHGGPGGDRFGPVEHTAYTIDAKLMRYKLEEEDDQDFHIVITDWSRPGTTMIVEIPDPQVVDTSSPWLDEIVKARGTFESAFRPTNRFTRRTAHIRVTGIGFFDFLHGQSGVAPNGIELHPVLKIEVME